jgi:DNA invertase Pin-like site-specific DNA recombinase
MLVSLEPGDTLAVSKLDQLGRSLWHLVKVIEDMEARGVYFVPRGLLLDQGQPANRS